MTASRLAALTLGELRRTSETSDLDTPARAATVSRVGFPAVRPGVATWPLLPLTVGALQPYECGEMVSTTPTGCVTAPVNPCGESSRGGCRRCARRVRGRRGRGRRRRR